LLELADDGADHLGGRLGQLDEPAGPAVTEARGALLARERLDAVSKRGQDVEFVVGLEFGGAHGLGDEAFVAELLEHFLALAGDEPALSEVMQRGH